LAYLNIDYRILKHSTRFKISNTISKFIAKAVMIEVPDGGSPLS